MAPGAVGHAIPARADCTLAPEFQALHALIPDIAGDCTGDPLAQDNGDIQQPTTAGLLVWRKADNLAEFTDGTTTWIDGPNGLASRPNDQCFSWETCAAATATPLPTAAPVGNLSVS